MTADLQTKSSLPTSMGDSYSNTPSIQTLAQVRLKGTFLPAFMPALMLQILFSLVQDVEDTEADPACGIQDSLFRK